MNKYNLITAESSVVPNYNVSKKDLSINIYISPLEEVCIIGKVDNNYICWCSITNVSDKETNAEIFNILLSLPSERMYSTDYKVLGSRYSDIKRWHFFSVTRQWYEGHLRYRSPVSNCFLGTPPHDNGLFLANETQNFFRNELCKCHYRLIDDVYVTVLRRYITLLLKDSSPEYYHQMLPIIAILENESYLKLCPIEEVRGLYLECLEKRSELYNSYMSASH
jgi:hypothetical protein